MAALLLREWTKDDPIVHMLTVIRTICCKLDVTAEQAAAIDDALDRYADACNAVADACRALGSTNRVDVHHACYREIRRWFGLAANHAVRAIARTCIALKVPEKADSAFRPTSLDLDARTFRFHEADGSFGITLLQGRVRFPALLGDFQRQALRGRAPTSAVLVKRREGGYFLHVQIEDQVPETGSVSDHLGVDLGVVNLAVDSDGQAFSGAGVEAARRRYAKHRRGLNKRGSKSARRRLRKVRRREANFRRNENHIIAKRLVEKAKATGRGLALEDLEGIRGRVNARRSQRSRLHGWAFHQLRQFVVYKAARAGVPVHFVDPRDTSRTCPECGHCRASNRVNRNDFVCGGCGHRSPADLVGARNIRSRAPVRAPIVGADDAGGGSPAEAAYKPPALAGGI
jgi:IS605 OrfB family transposase